MANPNIVEKRIETGEEPRPRRTVVFCRGRNLRLLTINRLVLEISARFALAGAPRITSPVTEGETYLLLDWEEMEEALKGLMESAIMDRRPAVAIQGMWLPVLTGRKRGEAGCAFISISFAEKRSTRRFGFARNMERKEPSRELSGLWGVVERHHGAVRLIRRQGKTILNVYLPVLDKT